MQPATASSGPSPPLHPFLVTISAECRFISTFQEFSDGWPLAQRPPSGGRESFFNRRVKLEKIDQSGRLKRFANRRRAARDFHAAVPTVEVPAQPHQLADRQAGHEGQLREIEYRDRGA